MNARLEEKIFKIIFWLIAILAVFILVIIIGYVLSKGLGNITLEFLTENPRRMGTEGGIYSSIISTLYLVGLALLLSTPIGVGAAIFLAEYKTKGKFLKLIRFATESLAGIPSIVYGIFGYAFFVLFLKMGWSILAGGLTLTLMVLPIIVRTSEDAINAVPNSYREGSAALGATKWQTIKSVVLPAALPSIVTGIILSMGRAIGESAALILTAGTALGIPKSLFDPGRSLTIHLYVLAVEGISMDRAFATASVLIIIVITLNIIINIFTAIQKKKLCR